MKTKKAAKTRIQKLQNVTKALDFLEEQGVRTYGLNAFEIVGGNLKIQLGKKENEAQKSAIYFYFKKNKNLNENN